MRRLATACLLAVALAGCDPGPRSEADELAELGAIADPTPAEFKRRGDLARKRAEDEAEAERKAIATKRREDRGK